MLNGLPEDSRCPECGKPAAESAATLRQSPAWEASDRGRLRAFWRTTADCIFRPTRFFRSLSVRPANAASRRFARIHWLAAAVLFGTAGWFHANGFGGLGISFNSATADTVVSWLAWPVLIIVTYLFLFGLNSLAARLTTFEATHRGLRLPRPVVLRAMHYHAAHYLPVGLLAAASVIGFRILLATAPSWAGRHEIIYLYVICGEVVVAAVYLFKTYWIAMRNLMYANR